MIEKLFRLDGKVALVTGGSRGLGKAMAHGLAEAGAEVAIASRNEAELSGALVEILDGTGQKGRYFVCDLSRRVQAQSLAESVLDEFGRVDILINNAGINIPQPIDEVTDSDWDLSMDVNLNSAMALTRALTPQMKQRGWGRVIYISSIMGLASKAGRNSYSATKSALIGLTKANALDLAEFGITVNCIAPGPFLTDLPASVLNEDQQKFAAGRTAMERWGRPEELVGPALLLASDAGSYMTGSVILVDGGLMCKTF
jgi:NAD(P)-dependent dehydrogenase (short-subunit alcohol dehydrogenase family)